MAHEEYLAHLRSLPYAQYLKTDWWKHTSGKAIKRARGKCELCLGRQAREVHHTTYDRLGCEEPDDLVAVCKECHQHITDNGLDRTPRRDLLQRRGEFRHSPEFARGWSRY